MRKLLVLAFLLVPVSFASAAYLPGETLTPTCPPTDPTCIVVGYTASTYNATSTSATSTLPNTTITSLSVTGFMNTVLAYISSLTAQAATLYTATVGSLTSTSTANLLGGVNTSNLTATGTTNLSMTYANTIYASTSFATSSTVGTLSATNASTTQLTVSNRLYDGSGSAGTNGYVLQTTGTGVQWVATSTLGLTGGGSSVSGSNTFSATNTFATTSIASSTVVYGNITNLFGGNATITNATTTNFYASGTILGGGLNVTNATATTINVSGGVTSGSSTVTGTTTSGGLFSSFISALSSVFTNLTASNATTTNLAVSGMFKDSSNSAGTNGYVLQTTGSGVQWVATSTLGLTGGGSSVSGSNTFSATNTFATTSIASSTITYGNITNLVSNTSVLGNATATALDVSGGMTAGSSTVSGTTTTGGLFASFISTITSLITNLVATNAVVTNGTTTNATSTNFAVTNLSDAAGSTGTDGYILRSTPTGVQWVSTSSLGITGGGSSVTTNVTNSFSATNTFATTSIASSTITYGNITNLVSDSAVFSNATSTTMSVSGGLTAGSSTVSGTTTTGGLFASFLSAVTSIFTNLTATNATTTNLAVAGTFKDSANSAGTNGYVLQTTGTGVQWVATSTLGLGGSGASMASSNNFSATNTFATTSIASSTIVYGNITNLVSDSAVFSNATSTTMSVSGGLTAGSSTVSGTMTAGALAAASSTITGTTTTGGLFASFLSAVTAAFSSLTTTNLMAANATTTNFFASGLFTDGFQTAPAYGSVLINTGTTTQWVATSTLGITGGGGASTGSTNTFTAEQTFAAGIVVTNATFTAATAATFAATGSSTVAGVLSAGSVVTGSTTVTGTGTFGSLDVGGGVTASSTGLTANTVNATNLNVTGSFSAALAQGFVWAGNSSGLSAATSSLFIASNQNVGIGTTTPGYKFAVTNTASAAQAAIAYDGTRYTNLQTDSTGDYHFNPSGLDSQTDDGNLWVCSGGACPTGAPSGTGNLVVETGFALGTSTPSGALFALQAADNSTFITMTAAGAGRFTVGTDASGNTMLYTSNSKNLSLGIGAAPTNLVINGSSGSVGIGSSTPAEKLGVSGKLFVSNGLTTNAMGTATSTFMGDIKIMGKLDVGTIDPPYAIDGVKYATFAPSMIGVKEEMTQNVQLVKQSDGTYAAKVAFKSAVKGSDEWLFYQITDFGDNWKDLVVVLAPGFDGKVRYEKDVANTTLMIYGSQAGEVGVRLSAPRYDHEKWGNLRSDQIGEVPHNLQSK